MNENWLDIEDYKGIYMISDHGNVKSLQKIVRGSLRKERLLKPKKHRDGYFAVVLQNNKKRKNYFVHRLVAIAFCKNNLQKPDVNHIDGNKENNFYQNLEWVTSKENSIHAVNLGLCPHSVGENHIKSKLKNKDILEIRKLWDGTNPYNQDNFSIKYKISKSNIAKILKRETWKHI